MQFLNPLAAWAGLGLVCVVALYMLRRRHEPREVQHTSVAVGVALAAGGAAFAAAEKESADVAAIAAGIAAIAVADAARDTECDGRTGTGAGSGCIGQHGRGDRWCVPHGTGEARGARMVDALPGGSRVSIVAAGSEVRQVLSRASGKQQILRAIDSMRAEHGGAQLTEALALLCAVRQEIPQMWIAVLTDDERVSIGDEARVIPIGPGWRTARCCRSRPRCARMAGGHWRRSAIMAPPRR